MKYVQLGLFDYKTSIVLSLKQKYFDKIICGEKKYEYRFKFPKESVEAYIYIPSPHKKIVGVIELRYVKWMEKEEACKFYQSVGDGKYETMYEWIGFRKGCYVSKICSLVLFEKEIDFRDLKDNYGFYAPQEWTYLHNNAELHNFLITIRDMNINKKEEKS